MVPWIQVYSNLSQHPKTTKLADELGITSAAVDPNTIAVGLLVCLWTWAINNATDGNLAECSPRAIAGACQWKKKPEVLIAALQKAGWIDPDMKLHDWEEYACQMIEREADRAERTKAQTRERVQRYRERQRNAGASNGNAGGNADVTLQGVTGNVTVTPPLCPPSPFPPDPLSLTPLYPPGHNQTRPEQNITGQNITPLSGGGGDAGAGASASEEITGFLWERNQEPRVMLGYSDELYAECKELADAIFERFCSRQHTARDVDNVFFCVFERAKNPLDGKWYGRIDPSYKELLLYAFEKAADAGKAGEWPYIEGILGRLRRRGLKNAADADDYDWERGRDTL